MLELGASPNYKDARGLTPLYLSVIKKTDAKICESLLHDHATLGTQDSQGWQEVHQVRSFYSLLSILNLYLRNPFILKNRRKKYGSLIKLKKNIPPTLTAGGNGISEFYSFYNFNIASKISVFFLLGSELIES